MNLRQLLPPDDKANKKDQIDSHFGEEEDQEPTEDAIEAFNEAEFVESLIQNHQTSQSRQDITTTNVRGTAWGNVSFKRTRGTSPQGDSVVEEELFFSADGLPITRKNIHETLRRCPQSMHIVSKESVRECSVGGHPCCVFCSKVDTADGNLYCDEHFPKNPLRRLVNYLRK